MLKYTFPAFLFFSFGLILYGAIVDYIFPSVAGEFYFYTIHNNVLSLLVSVMVGTGVCVFGRYISSRFLRAAVYSTPDFGKITRFIKLKGPMLGVFCGAFFLSIDGITFLPERVGYRVDGEVVLSTLYALSGLCGLFCIPLLALAWSSKNSLLKQICFITFMFVIVCYFAKASRIFVLAPILYFIVSYYSGVRIYKYLAALAVLAMPITTSFILELRGQTMQGLVPFFNFLVDGSSEYTLFELFRDFFVSFSSGFFIFVETANSAVWMNFEDIWVSLNPQFGSAAGWGAVFEEYRIGDAIPYSSIGELLAFSHLLFYGFCFFMGILFGRAENNVKAGSLLGVAQIIVLLYMSALMPQYNLRSVVRFIYLVVAIDVAVLLRIYIFPRLKLNVPKRAQK